MNVQGGTHKSPDATKVYAGLMLGPVRDVEGPGSRIGATAGGPSSDAALRSLRACRRGLTGDRPIGNRGQMAVARGGRFKAAKSSRIDVVRTDAGGLAQRAESGTVLRLPTLDQPQSLAQHFARILAAPRGDEPFNQVRLVVGEDDVTGRHWSNKLQPGKSDAPNRHAGADAGDEVPSIRAISRRKQQFLNVSDHGPGHWRTGMVLLGATEGAWCIVSEDFGRQIL